MVRGLALPPGMLSMHILRYRCEGFSHEQSILHVYVSSWRCPACPCVAIRVSYVSTCHRRSFLHVHVSPSTLKPNYAQPSRPRGTHGTSWSLGVTPEDKMQLFRYFVFCISLGASPVLFVYTFSVFISVLFVGILWLYPGFILLGVQCVHPCFSFWCPLAVSRFYFAWRSPCYHVHPCFIFWCPLAVSHFYFGWRSPFSSQCYLLVFSGCIPVLFV